MQIAETLHFVPPAGPLSHLALSHENHLHHLRHVQQTESSVWSPSPSGRSPSPTWHGSPRALPQSLTGVDGISLSGHYIPILLCRRGDAQYEQLLYSASDPSAAVLRVWGSQREFEFGNTVDRGPRSADKWSTTQHRLLKACFTTGSVLLIEEPIQERGTQGK